MSSLHSRLPIISSMHGIQSDRPKMSVILCLYIRSVTLFGCTIRNMLPKWD